MYTLVWVGPNGTIFAKDGFNHPVHADNWVRKYLGDGVDYVVAVTKF